LRKIVCWPAAGSSIIIDALANGSAEQALMKDSIKNSDIPIGVTVDRPVVFRPKRGTYLDMWQSVATNGTDQLFAISGATGGVMDFHLVFTLVGASAAVTQTTSSTVALGSVRYMNPDTGNKIGVIGLLAADH